MKQALLSIALFFFGIMPLSSQVYVNSDQAVTILQQEIEDLEAQGMQLWSQKNSTALYDLGYKYRYASRMLGQINSGATVANAVEVSLPAEPFVIGIAESGEKFDDPNFEFRKTSLRNWARQLLTR